MKNLLRALAALLCLVLAPLAARAQNYSDIWWNPAESGWGLTIADHQSNLFAVWFTYRQDGKPTWYVIPGGTFTGNRTHFTGDIYSTTGPAFSSASFDPSRVTVSKVGTATIDFASPGSGTFAYSVAGVTQSKPIQRQPFGNASPAWGGDVTDIWYNPNESGWGLTLAQHGNDVFGVWFTYDTDGQPLWAVMPGVTFNGSAAFTGSLYTTTGPYFGAVPFDSSRVVVTPQGSATMTLASGAGAQCSGQQAGTFSASFRGASVQKATCHQPFGDSPVVTSVDAPAPMAAPPGTPKQQAAAFADALAKAGDSRTRLAAWLGVYKALSMPVIDANGNSITGTGDDPVGPPYWAIWYGSGMDQPMRGMTLEEAGRVLGMDHNGAASAAMGELLLGDLRAAYNDDDPQLALVGAFVRERILRGRSKQDLMSTPLKAADLVVDPSTVQLMQWVLLRQTMAGIARAHPHPVKKASAHVALKALPTCDELFGDTSTTKMVNFLTGKFYGGIKVPFTDIKLFPGATKLALTNLGVAAETVDGINDKYFKSANAVASAVSLYMQVSALQVEFEQPGPLVRSRNTGDGAYQAVRWHLFSDIDSKPDGKDFAACLTTYALRTLGVKLNLPTKAGIPGADIVFDAGHNIPEKVYFDTSIPHYRITTDSTGWAIQNFRGRAQKQNLPNSAKAYDDTFNVIVSAQPSGVTGSSLVDMFTDGFSAAAKPSFASVVAPIVDLMKTLHYELGEYTLLMTDWAAGYEIDYTHGDTHVTGTVCDLERPFSLDFDTGGMIKGNINFTPSDATRGTASLNAVAVGAPIIYAGSGIYNVLGTIYGDQRLLFNIPTMTATLPNGAVVVPGVASTMPLLPTNKCMQ